MSQVVVVHSPDFHFDYYSIIFNITDERQVLILSDENNWSLPHFLPYEHHFGMVGHINKAMKAQLGLNVTTLRCFYEDYNMETKTGCRVYAMENHSPHWTLPANARWVQFHELDDLTFVNSKVRQVLKTWFTETDSDNIPVLRVPWAKIGWFDRTATWINLQLNSNGLCAFAPIEQVKSQTRSCLLKVSTTDGKLYFKAVFGIFGKEPTLTDFLAQLYPNHLPKLLAVDTEQQWMLMWDFGGNLLSEVADISQWEEALRLEAEIQIQAVHQVDKLLDIGFPDRRIEQLASQIKPLFADKSALLVPQNDPILSETEIETLSSLVPQLVARCNELDGFGIPQTLIHGDFHCQNVVVTNERFIYFDWSDSAISHPFFDAGFFLHEITQEFPEVTDVQLRLRNAYLKPWTAFMPMEELITVFQKSQILATLYQAIVSYEITKNLEVSHRWETENAVPYYLKSLLTQIQGTSKVEFIDS
ncbi:aminoglycoside phosphotransferase family protein [Nostoc sp. CCY 9925]|uniref:aminoglycoside phosphotransferase family protein n=1 Tax=Nostoc sp. CCY 9925 TaxID=3103865 RepID=UPI0039C5AD61